MQIVKVVQAVVIAVGDSGLGLIGELVGDVIGVVAGQHTVCQRILQLLIVDVDLVQCEVHLVGNILIAHINRVVERFAVHFIVGERADHVPFYLFAVEN